MSRDEVISAIQSSDEIVSAIQRRHGSWAAGIARDALRDYTADNPTDLCGVLRKVWNSCPDERHAAAVIAQAIDLGLGIEKAKQVLAQLERRDLTADKIG